MTDFGQRHRLLTRAQFLRRLLDHVLIGCGLIFLALAIGVAGYHLTESMPWIDALLNASMILGGMGPVDRMATTAGKLFASVYALFCGFVALGVAGIILGPVVHRVLHRFHLDEEPDK